MRIGFSVVLILVLGGATQTVAQSAGEVFQDCGRCPEMVVIPPGTAILGSEPWIANRKLRDAPIRKVEITYSFAVSKNEITRAQYRQIVEATGFETHYEPPRVGCNTWNYDGLLGYVLDHTWEAPGFDQAEDHPVVCVSWADARAYAAWLADLTGKPYRLLSSTEFEYALRAGTRGPWYWGSDNAEACKHANSADSTYRRLYDFGPVFDFEDGLKALRPYSFESLGV